MSTKTLKNMQKSNENNGSNGAKEQTLTAAQVACGLLFPNEFIPLFPQLVFLSPKDLEWCVLSFYTGMWNLFVLSNQRYFDQVQEKIETQIDLTRDFPDLEGLRLEYQLLEAALMLNRDLIHRELKREIDEMDDLGLFN